MTDHSDFATFLMRLDGQLSDEAEFMINPVMLSRLADAESRTHVIASSCSLCPRRCHVNRLAGERGFCGADMTGHVFYSNILYGEEFELCPSYEIFLAGCNMRCSFCYVKTWIDGYHHEKTVLLSTLQPSVEKHSCQCRSLQFIGGEPTVNLPGILSFLKQLDHSPPIVWNTNLFMDSSIPEILDGIADIYIADLHFFSKQCSLTIGGADEYFTNASRALLMASRYASVIVRHLLIPNHLECCCKPIIDWLQTNLPNVPFHLMGNYYSDVGGVLDPGEYQAACQYAENANLRLYSAVPPVDRPPISDLRDFGSEEEIVIEHDGRIYIQHLTKELLEIIAALNPTDPSIQAKQRYFKETNV